MEKLLLIPGGMHDGEYMSMAFLIPPYGRVKPRGPLARWGGVVHGTNAQLGQVVAYERLGLGSYTEPRDAELYALTLGLQLLCKTPHPDTVKEVYLILDSEWGLRQLRRTKPEPGHNITVSWWVHAC